MPLIKDFPSIAEDHSEMQERVLMVLQATGGTEPASLALVPHGQKETFTEC